LIDQYVAENKIDAAVKELFDLVVIYARAKDFNTSELLREKLIRIDPMALSEIIKSGDIIEEEKSRSQDKEHMKIWSKLYDVLTDEEKNTLFFAMKEILVEPRVSVIEQGKSNDNLYFVDNGQLKMTCRLEEREVLVKKIEAGDFAGDETFFPLSAFSSVSLITESDVKMKYLHKSVLKKWAEKDVGLVNKLYDYCIKSGLTHEIISKMKLNRRLQKRYDIDGTGIFQIINKSGEAVGSPFRGSLSDISLGGMAFVTRITKKETARILIGKNLKIKIDLPSENGILKLEKTGMIIGIHADSFEDYLLHVKFDSDLDKTLIDLVERKSSLKQ
jgi:CRP-like cAMP-binding protein